jgi:uncharacterized protein (TIGR03382 family)
MSPLSLIIAAFVLGIPAMFFAFAGGGVVVGVPITIAWIAVLGALDVRRRRTQSQSMGHLRQEARAGSSATRRCSTPWR